mgnify:CR=1 FL=1
MNQAAKYATKSALTAVGMSATLAKYGLKATDSMFGGALKMANEFAPNSLGTPIKDLSKGLEVGRKKSRRYEEKHSLRNYYGGTRGKL